MARVRDSRGRFVSSTAGGRQQDTDPGFRGLAAQYQDAVGREMEVGIFDGQVGEYALINEVGTSDGRIPARPWMGTTIDDNRARYVDDLAKALGRAMDQGKDLGAVMKAYGLTVVRGELIKAIQNWRTPPNAPSTIRQKRGVNNPLVDTGAMQRALEVRTKGE